jgi:enhancing lycopene biosynthesis protein 2
MQIAITLASISTGTIAKGPSMGQKFTTSKGATAHFSNGDKPVTVMAFGKQRDSVSKLLRKGKKVTVTAVWDGKNVLKILGPQRVDAPADDSAEG